LRYRDAHDGRKVDASAPKSDRTRFVHMICDDKFPHALLSLL
jgi:hypothetical protein